MSKYRLSAYDGKPQKHEIAGITWLLVHDKSQQANAAKLYELLHEKGLSFDEYRKMRPHEQTRWAGRVAANTFVVGFEPFDIEFDGGETLNVTFDGRSDNPFYETSGEEFLGENPEIQDLVMSRVTDLENFKNKAEGQVLKKSLNPSPSGDPSPVVDITLTSSTEASPMENPYPSS